MKPACNDNFPFVLEPGSTDDEPWQAETLLFVHVGKNKYVKITCGE